jgi:Tat protein secretion system quality control protein TatD with DNase activity
MTATGQSMLNLNIQPKNCAERVDAHYRKIYHCFSGSYSRTNKTITLHYSVNVEGLYKQQSSYNAATAWVNNTRVDLVFQTAFYIH